MYTNPDSVLSRRSGNWQNIERVLGRFPDDRQLINRLRFKIFSLSKDSTRKGKNGAEEVIAPQKHGSFSGMRYWDRASWW